MFGLGAAIGGTVLKALAPGLIKAGGSMLGNLFGKQKNTAPNPAKINMAMPDIADYGMPDQSDYAIDDATIASMNSGAIDQMMRQNAMTQANIKQVGAAGRMPGGAVLDALAGANYNLGRGFGSINDDTTARLKAEGQFRFADAKQNAMSRYASDKMTANMNEAQLTADFLRGKKEAKQSQRNQWGNMFDDMSNMALLQRAGFFNNGGG